MSTRDDRAAVPAQELPAQELPAQDPGMRDAPAPNCAVTPYGRGAGSARVRVFEWLDRVDADFVVSSYLSRRDARPAQLARRPAAVARAERRLRELADARPERLLLHREASPLSRGGLERRLMAAAGFAVYDFDDALQWDHGDGGLARRWAPKAAKALAAVGAADRVVAGCPVLADWASGYHHDVRIIPSCVDPASYLRKTGYELHDPPRLGWLGSPGNECYLLLVADALAEVHARTGARLTLIGTTRRSLGPLERLIDRVAWSEAVQRTVLAELDLGLMPLPDTPYSRGKCGYKLLQYGAAGVPAVADPIGVNEEILDRFGAAAPREPGEWTEVLLGLLDCSSDRRARLGARAHDVTRRQYSFQAWLPAWRSALELPPPAAPEPPTPPSPAPLHVHPAPPPPAPYAAGPGCSGLTAVRRPPAGPRRPASVRRAVDVAVGSLALVGLSPLLGGIALLVRGSSRGPAVYRQQRVGEGGAEFTLYKFRSMRWRSEGPELTGAADPRVTPVGALLRRAHLDELPQLVNLVRGDMTLVGPRPETPGMARRYPRDCRWVFDHRPGITGPVQLRASELAAPPDGVPDPEGYYLDVLVPRRVALDAEYLATRSPLRDLGLVLRTLRQVLGAVEPARADDVADLVPGRDHPEQALT
ncbi:sugar transferase [Streptacidiphilus sp. EB129]|uniref:sugar transferase n=1 Tax=Streptacidiphilus sp. EB129 TaxID=3156262 RepID=UPI0035131AA0